MLHPGHKQSELYQKTVQLAKEVYRMTEVFPDGERAVMVYTLRRLAVLLCQELAIGLIKKAKKQRQAFETCLEHCVALDAQLELAKAVNFVTNENMRDATNLLNSIYENLVRLVQQA